MPHLIIEHSSNFPKNSVTKLQKVLQDAMNSCEGNFDADQCKCRSFSFDEYFVGKNDQSNSSFIHVTLKALSGRTTEVRKNLALKLMEYIRGFVDELELKFERCDISVDIVEMQRETYQKIRIGM